MESDQEGNKPAKNNSWLVILTTVLAIASIGIVASMYIPAASGQHQPPRSLFNAIIALGLLFMSIWALIRKNKLVGFLVGAFLGFILNLGAPFTGGYLSAEKRAIDKAVTESNKGLPKMLDEETRLDSVSIDQERKHYYLSMTFLNLSKQDIDIDLFNNNYQESIKPSSCKNETLKVFFNEGYTINAVYRDKAGVIVGQYSVKPTDCSK